MKRITLLLIAAFSISLLSLRAQVITIDPASHQLHFSAAEFSDAHSEIQNNSGIERSIKWILKVNEEPSGWYTTVCDDYTCYAPGTMATPAFVDLKLAALGTGLMKLNVFPNAVVGTASYEILVYDVNDSANANATMTVDVVTEPNTGISGVKEEVISIYPNPVKNILYINLDGSKGINKVDIHNVVGQKIQSISIETGIKSIAIPVADLKKGIYFLRVFSNGKEMATKTFSKE